MREKIVSLLNGYCLLDRLFSSRICHGRLEIAGPVALFYLFSPLIPILKEKCFLSLLRRKALVYNVRAYSTVSRVWRYSNSVVGDCSITICIQLVVTLVAFTQRGIIIVSFLRFDRNPRERNVIFLLFLLDDGYQIPKKREMDLPFAFAFISYFILRRVIQTTLDIL